MTLIFNGVDHATTSLKQVTLVTGPSVALL